jgi:hypothetical protein
MHGAPEFERDAKLGPNSGTEKIESALDGNQPHLLDPSSTTQLAINSTGSMNSPSKTPSETELQGTHPDDPTAIRMPVAIPLIGSHGSSLLPGSEGGVQPGRCEHKVCSRVHVCHNSRTAKQLFRRGVTRSKQQTVIVNFAKRISNRLRAVG